ncbi:heparan sulfate glucosamine 3-O-sulfotransferase 6, partial [Candidatus Thiomargarita nelsonii]
AKRIHQFNPNMKLIYIVREPYEKFISTWRMKARLNFPVVAKRGINYFFEHDSNNKWSTVKSCCYSYQLEAYKQYFPEDAFLIIFLEELSREPLQQYERVFQFIKLEHSKFDWNNIHIKENGANQHYKTNKYWTYLQQSRMRTLVKNVLPTTLIRLATQLVGPKKIFVPREELSEENKKE